MNSTLKHNHIIKYCFDGNKHLQKVLSDKQILDMTVTEGRFPFTKLPVCGGCESLGLWHKDPLTSEPVGICRKCGTVTKKPITYSTYLATGYDVDTTGDTFRRMLLAERKLDENKRKLILPDFTRIDRK